MPTAGRRDPHPRHLPRIRRLRPDWIGPDTGDQARRSGPRPRPRRAPPTTIEPSGATPMATLGTTEPVSARDPVHHLQRRLRAAARHDRPLGRPRDLAGRGARWLGHVGTHAHAEGLQIVRDAMAATGLLEDRWLVQSDRQAGHGSARPRDHQPRSSRGLGRPHREGVCRRPRDIRDRQQAVRRRVGHPGRRLRALPSRRQAVGPGDLAAGGRMGGCAATI